MVLLTNQTKKKILIIFNNHIFNQYKNTLYNSSTNRTNGK